MRVYIIQHAEAMPKADNPPVRLLTDKGVDDTRRLAGILKAEGVAIDRVLHVGTDWTRDNAEKLATFLASNIVAAQTSYQI